MKKREKTKKDGWVLYTGPYEIKWKNGVADEVSIEGVRLKIQPHNNKTASLSSRQ